MTAIAAGWNRFWFEPVSTSTLGILRVAFGLLVFLWGLSVLPDALTLYGADGVAPEVDLERGQVGILNWISADWAVLATIAALLVAALATMLGYHARLATVVVFIALLSLRRRNPWIVNAGDGLMRHISLFLALAPSGAALSLDRWRRHRDRFWNCPLRAPWALRLIQVQVSILYLFTTWEKAKGDEWIAGTAVSSSLRVGDVTRFDVPYALSESLVIGNLLAYGTLAVELALAVLIWNRRARPWVIAAGVALHLFIEAAFSLGFFSAVILVSYLSFIPEDTGDRWVHRLHTYVTTPARRTADQVEGSADVASTGGTV